MPPSWICFQIEAQRHFFPVLCIAIGGFAIHALLPTGYRLHFFALLSIGTVLFVLGMSSGLWVLGIGSVLIGICCLPIRFALRVAMLVASAATLCWLRASYPLPFWPVLGSMVYVPADPVYARVQTGFPTAIACLVSVLLLSAAECLFSVVSGNRLPDISRQPGTTRTHGTFIQRGVTWIVRGLIHLLLYRYIRAHLVPQPYELYDVPHVAVFMATNYALYLQVSGQFHLITGLLHLFGFNLPRTHHLFFLASGFKRHLAAH